MGDPLRSQELQRHMGLSFCGPYQSLEFQGDDLQSLDPLEMPQVISEKRETLVKTCGSDQQIKVTDDQATLAENTPVLSEDFAYLFIHS
jgi:hypothetical protein